MKLNKLTFGLLLCGVVLIATPIGSEFMDKDSKIYALNAALPSLNGLVGLLLKTPPTGPLLASGLGLIHVASMIITGAQEENDVGQTLTNLDLMNLQSAVTDEVQKVDSHILEESQRIISELTHSLKSHPFFEDMRNTMEYMRRTSADYTEVVLNSKLTGLQKKSTMNLMADPRSNFRDTLRYFVSKFIKPNLQLSVTGSTQLFFDYILEKDSLLAKDNEDGRSESLHSKLLKAYVLIAKILTDSYVLPIAAEAIQYQGEIKGKRVSDSLSTRRDTLKLINDYKDDMKTLIDKTKWALDKASREIRNTGTFDLKKGENFQRLPFAQIIPRIMGTGSNGCRERKGPFVLNDFELLKCNSYKDFILPNSQMSIFRKVKDLDRPYQYLKFKTPSGKEQIYGHKNSDSRLMKEQASTDASCPTVFCPAFKKDAVAISTQRVRAQRGNVITGVRFRVEDGILYVDIQEGKFLNLLSVDPKTVVWTKAPAGGPVTYLSANVRKLQLGNFELTENFFLTSIQLKQGRARDGFIFVFIEGANPSNWYSFPQGSVESIPETEELLIDGDDPEKSGLKNLISKAPEYSDRFFVQFQPSNFKKDLGRSTIPYIDTREVVSNPPAPMSGFGIYHEAGDGSGGLLALKLISPILNSLPNYEEIEKFTQNLKS